MKTQHLSYFRDPVSVVKLKSEKERTKFRREKQMEEPSETKKEEEWVYRISAEAEWEELQHKGSTHGGDLDRTTGCIHLSHLNQGKMTLANFFAGREDLHLLQIDASKIEMMNNCYLDWINHEEASRYFMFMTMKD